MFKLIKLLAYVPLIIIAFQDFTRKETTEFLTLINNERTNKLTMNYGLESVLKDFVKQGGAVWGYKDSGIQSDSFARILNFRIMAKNSTFVSILKTYNQSHLLNKHLEVAHDTFVDAGKKNTAINILKMRTKQKWCYDKHKCSLNKFSNYISCSVYEVKDFIVRRPCQWFYFYYPRFVSTLVEEIAVVKLQMPGRFAPIKRQNNAWLIVFVMSREQKNDSE
jgi:hypothetical protein